MPDGAQHGEKGSYHSQTRSKADQQLCVVLSLCNLSYLVTAACSVPQDLRYRLKFLQLKDRTVHYKQLGPPNGWAG